MCASLHEKTNSTKAQSYIYRINYTCITNNASSLLIQIQLAVLFNQRALHRQIIFNQQALHRQILFNQQALHRQIL